MTVNKTTMGCALNINATPIKEPMIIISYVRRCFFVIKYKENITKNSGNISFSAWIAKIPTHGKKANKSCPTKAVFESKTFLIILYERNTIPAELKTETNFIVKKPSLKNEFIKKIIYFDDSKEIFDINQNLGLKISLFLSTIIVLVYFIYPSLLIDVVSNINLIWWNLKFLSTIP